MTKMHVTSRNYELTIQVKYLFLIHVLSVSVLFLLIYIVFEIPHTKFYDLSNAFRQQLMILPFQDIISRILHRQEFVSTQQYHTSLITSHDQDKHLILDS